MFPVSYWVFFSPAPGMPGSGNSLAEAGSGIGAAWGIITEDAGKYVIRSGID
jgi:hypothetical protein